MNVALALAALLAVVAVAFVARPFVREPEPVSDLGRGSTPRRNLVEDRGPRAHSHDLIAVTPPGTQEPQAPMR